MRRLFLILTILLAVRVPFAHAAVTSVDMSNYAGSTTVIAGHPFTITVQVTSPSTGDPMIGTIEIAKITQTSPTNVAIAGPYPVADNLQNGRADVTFTPPSAGTYSVDICYKELYSSTCVTNTGVFTITATQPISSMEMAIADGTLSVNPGQAFSATVQVADNAGNPLTGSISISKITRTSPSPAVALAGPYPEGTPLVDSKATLTYTLPTAGTYSVDVCYQESASSACVVNTNVFTATATAVTSGSDGSGSSGTGSGSGSTGSGSGSGVTIPNPIPCADAACVISQVIKYVLGSIALIATGMFIWGGFLMLTAAGNEKRVEQAKETLAWAAIGIVVIILSWSMIRYLLTSLTKASHN